jgi:hypothetical protein
VIDENPDSFVRLELVTQTIRIYALKSISSTKTTCLVLEASWAINTIAYPKQDVRTRRVIECFDIYLDMLEGFRLHPGQTCSTIRGFFHELLELRGTGYICVIIRYKFLARTNYITILELMVQVL